MGTIRRPAHEGVKWGVKEVLPLIFGFLVVSLALSAQGQQMPPLPKAPASLANSTNSSVSPSSASPSASSLGAAIGSALPGQLTVNLGGGSSRERMAMVIKILAVFTILSLAPSILVMMTSFTRIVVVLSFVRRALGLQEAPPTQVIIGLALFLTFFTMAPTWNKVYRAALAPYMAGELAETEAYERGITPVREFMFKNTRKDELSLFISISRIPRPNVRADVPSYVLMPAFMVSEIKTAFIIGFLIFIPFLVIDMVVSSVLLAMGMMMLPPVIVSLPFKIILFVLVDGWSLIIGSLIQSYM